MALNIGNNYKTEAAAYEYQKNVSKTATEDEAEANGTAAAGSSAVTKVDTFQKSNTYAVDRDKINAMKADLSNNVSAFKQMVQNLFKRQGTYSNSAMGKLLNIDKSTQLKAQEAISEDGEWGVTKTADRILDFAKALSGGDPSKIAVLKNAVEKGFAAAGKAWGGKMPDITQQTYKRVMDGFDAWENESKANSI